MDDIDIGKAIRGWGDFPLTLSVADRRHHMLVIGQTGVGKSTLLKNLLVQDILAGRGCALLDPHGDLALEILDHVPRQRIDDVVYFDPADLVRVPALNPLARVPVDERPRVAEEVVAAIASIWGLSPAETPRLLYILSNIVMALLDVPNGATLLGIPRMLVDEDYRRRVMRHVGNPQVLRFWRDEFARWPQRMQAEASSAVLNKAEMLVHAPSLYLTLGQIGPTIRPEAIMDEGRIFIANLSKGMLGETSSQLLGALLVASFDLAARRRASVPEAARKDFVLVADEFQNFASERFASILSEARKYRLSLVLATQYLQQVPESVRAAIVGNAGSMVAFRVGDEDARLLARVMVPWPASALQELGRGEVVVRLLQEGVTTEAEMGRTHPALEERAGNRALAVEQSARRYTRSRSEVERKLLRWMPH